MTAFDLLSEPVRKYIRDQRWESLRPVQEAAIQRIMSTENNYVIISRTASGKTEAAFLPILSKVNFKEAGVKVLYISPLIALINDQFFRVEKLCNYLDVKVTKWHGEASKAQKEQLIKNPEGILLITPESLEAMFVNRPYHVQHLFSAVEYVVIDEIHAFLGSDRGTHLQSLLNRLQQINIKKYRTVGLSATVSDAQDYSELKDFIGSREQTKIIRDSTPKPIKALFKYFEQKEQNELPLPLLKDLYARTRHSKVLIFPNSRGRVEEIAVKLKKISSLVGGHQNYFSHHSSVDKEVREFVEQFAKKADFQNFCIACTSTLELGIDLGNVEEVVQIDATHSVASLIQRVGRSGRREGKASHLYLYATGKWSLLQSLACWLLYSEKYIEPIAINEKPYDVLLHQVLSIVKGSSGIYLKELSEMIAQNLTFSKISDSELVDIIDHLQKTDLLEKLGHEYIIGIEGEKIVNNRDFYSLFQTPVMFKVSSQGVKIGELELTPQIKEDENIYLAAKIWKIINIDDRTKKIEVLPANDGEKPRFLGNPSSVANRIRVKMLEILVCKVKYEFLDEAGQFILEDLRQEFSFFSIVNEQLERPLLESNENLTFYSFAGTKINTTLSFLLKNTGISHSLEHEDFIFKIKHDKADFIRKIKLIYFNEEQITEMVSELLAVNPGLIHISKWGTYLPFSYQVELLKIKHFDFNGCFQLLRDLIFVVNNSPDEFLNKEVVHNQTIIK